MSRAKDRWPGNGEIDETVKRWGNHISRQPKGAWRSATSTVEGAGGPDMKVSVVTRYHSITGAFPSFSGVSSRRGVRRLLKRAGSNL